MSLQNIAFKNMRRHKFRTALTVLGVAVAVFTFVLLRTVLSSWTRGAEHAAKDRIATRHKVTFLTSLPKRYVEDVRNVPGVRAATWCTWFGARLPARKDAFFNNIATDPTTFLQVYDELELDAHARQNWIENRRGAIVGQVLARQFGWKVGDKVTLEGSIYPGNWEFVIEGIYSAARKSTDQSSFYFHWDYLNESYAPGDRARDQVGWIVSKVDSAAEAASVSKRIDQRFDVQSTQTLSMSERALNTSFLGMFAAMLDAVDLVSFVILLIMMLILGNTIATAVRERTREYGVLRAIGFSSGDIAGTVVGEAVVIGLLGAGLGIALGYPLVNQGFGHVMEENFTLFFPYFRVTVGDAVLAAVIAIGLSALAAAIPAYQAATSNVTRALRRI